MTKIDFNNFNLFNSIGTISVSPHKSFQPFGPSPIKGSKLWIESEELHDDSVAYCIVRYTFEGGSEQTSRWEPLRAVISPPIFQKMGDGSSYETKVTREGNCTCIEVLSDAGEPFRTFPQRLATTLWKNARLSKSKRGQSHLKTLPSSPYVPTFSAFAIDVIFHDK